jgi:hypothetical protein
MDDIILGKQAGAMIVSRTLNLNEEERIEWQNKD